MKDNVHIPRQAEAKMRIPDVACHHFDLGKGGQVLQPSPVIEGIILAQGQNASALFHQGLSQVRADETVGASYKNFLTL